LIDVCLVGTRSCSCRVSAAMTDALHSMKYNHEEAMRKDGDAWQQEVWLREERLQELQFMLQVVTGCLGFRVWV
jgi:hypothetical protein